MELTPKQQYLFDNGWQSKDLVIWIKPKTNTWPMSLSDAIRWQKNMDMMQDELEKVRK